MQKIEPCPIKLRPFIRKRAYKLYARFSIENFGVNSDFFRKFFFQKKFTFGMRSTFQSRPFPIVSGAFSSPNFWNNWSRGVMEVASAP